MRKSTAAVVGALTLAVVAVPTVAAATNGGPVVLGRSNSETAPTYITNSTGVPLALLAKPGFAPLAVNSSAKIANLHADWLDGYSSASFAKTTGRTGVVADTNPDDAYGARCPAGTVATGGGGLAAYDAVQYNGPDFDVSGSNLVFIANSWVTLDTGGYVVPSWVVCYSSQGAVPGASTSIPNPYAGLAAMTAGGTPAPRHNPANLKANAGK